MLEIGYIDSPSVIALGNSSDAAAAAATVQRRNRPHVTHTAAETAAVLGE